MREKERGRDTKAKRADGNTFREREPREKREKERETEREGDRDGEPERNRRNEFISANATS